MKKLTERLAVIAELIGKGKTVADIGTDHGFLPIYLQSECESPRIILTDVSRLSLKKARDNINREYEPSEIEKYFDFRDGNGLSVLNHSEVDFVVFAGMGGDLMVDLLKSDIEKTKSFSNFIFQPRTASGHLRHWLVTNGFKIKDEVLVLEGKYICEVIGAYYDENAPKIDLPYVKNDAFYDITPKMLSDNKELCKSLIQKRIRQENFIYEGIHKSQNQTGVKEKLALHNLSYLKKLLENCDK